jgi:taurine dioxygenase
VKFDLGGYRRLSISPLTGAIGAEIGSVDASEELDAAVADELRRALAEFQVIFLRDQHLDERTVLRFARTFGEAGSEPLARRGADQPLVGRIARAADAPADLRNFGDRWHMDKAGDDCPSKGFVLFCEEVPDYGGDTMFTSLAAAYDALSPDHQAWLGGLTGVHSMSGVFGLDARNARTERVLGPEWRAAPEADADQLALIRHEAEHPLVCRHPDSGRPFLFVTGNYFLRIKELPEAESDRLIEELNRHVVRPDFTCRFRWRKGSVAVLDNRCTQHYAVNDYAGFARRMLRVELRGDWKPERAVHVQQREKTQ